MAGNDVTMLGTAQEQWLATNLAAAPATWHAIAQQTVFTPYAPDVVGAGVNLDLVYVATRNRVVFGAPDLDALRSALGVEGG